MGGSNRPKNRQAQADRRQRRQHHTSAAQDLSLQDLHPISEQDINSALQEQEYGDAEATMLLASILSSHDSEALRTILAFLTTGRQQRSSVVFWLKPFRITLLRQRAQAMQIAANALLCEGAALADTWQRASKMQWARVYYGIVQYHG